MIKRTVMQCKFC